MKPTNVQRGRPRIVCIEGSTPSFNLIRHAASKPQCASATRHGARRGHRPAAASGAGRCSLEKNLLRAALSELSLVLWRPTHLLNRHLDAEHRPRLAGLSTDKVEDAAGRRGGRRLHADDALLDLGRLGRRPPPQTHRGGADPNYHDDPIVCLRVPGLEPGNPSVAY